MRSVLSPFQEFNGAISVKLADLNGDGVQDMIVAAGRGGGPRVVILDGASGYVTKLADFMAFNEAFRGGVNIAIGDVNGDRLQDIVVGAGPGGGPHVKVFTYTGSSSVVEIAQFMAYGEGFRGGVNVAAGDVNGNGRAEIITGAGFGGGPHVKIIDGRSLARIRDFFAYDQGPGFGVNVAVGDVTGDGVVDIITAPAVGGGPLVRVFNGSTSALESQFFAYEALFEGGVNISVGRVPGFSRLAVLTGPGPSGGARIRGIDGLSGAGVYEQFLDNANFRRGIRLS